MSKISPSEGLEKDNGRLHPLSGLGHGKLSANVPDTGVETGSVRVTASGDTRVTSTGDRRVTG